ncbi:hypothetical protein Hanom_Chr12g01141571 [Helianthus anomalus]
MYVFGQNTELWTCFTTSYNKALEESRSSTATLANLAEQEKKTYDLEKKAFVLLTQHFWDTLQARVDGNATSRKTRHNLLKKELEGFMCMENKSLGEMTTRFYHILSEMFSYQVV